MTINAAKPDDVCLEFRLNDMVKTIDNLTSSITFDVVERQKYKFLIEQKPPEDNGTLISWLLFVLTCIIQGVWNVILMNTDWDWYNNIKPYRIKADLIIDIQKDTKIPIMYKNSKYNAYNRTWPKPLVSCTNGELSNIRFEPNFCDFQNQYILYIRRFISVFSIIVVIFALILFFAFKLKNYITVSITSAMISGLIVLTVFIIIKENRRCKRLLQSFKEKSSEGMQ